MDSIISRFTSPETKYLFILDIPTHLSILNTIFILTHTITPYFYKTSL